MKIIVSLFCLLFVFQLSAQKMFLGPEIGMNLIKIDEQNFGDNYRPSLYLGAAFDYQLNDLLSFKTGIYVSQKRQAFAESDTSLSEIFNFIGTSTIPGIDLNTYTTVYSRQSQFFIEIPLMASVRWNGLELFGGGYFGFNVLSSRKDKTVSNTPFMSTLQLDSLLGEAGGLLGAFLPKAYEELVSESSDNSNLKNFDYGLKIGVGYQKNQFGFFTSYNLGLADFRKDRGTKEIQRHQYFQFSIRYMFRVSKNSQSSLR